MNTFMIDAENIRVSELIEYILDRTGYMKMLKGKGSLKMRVE